LVVVAKIMVVNAMLICKVMLSIDVYHLQFFNSSLSSTSFCLLSDLLLKIIFQQLYIHTYHDIVLSNSYDDDDDDDHSVAKKMIVNITTNLNHIVALIWFCFSSFCPHYYSSVVLPYLEETTQIEYHILLQQL